MRVYEFSKNSGVSTKELLQALAGKGFAVKSHMSVLSQPELDFLEATFKQPSKPSVEKKETTLIQKTPAKVIPPIQTQPLQEKEPIKKTHTVPAVEKVVPPKPVASVEKNVPEKTVTITKEPEVVAPLEIVVEPMLVSDAAQKLKRPVNEVILTLLKWGAVANKNQVLAADLITRLAEHYQMKPVKPVAQKAEVLQKKTDVATGDFKERAPIVVVIGHVDHGKTTLLDFIRKTRVAAKEKGGITQHLGAYEATTSKGKVVFLDTPGHEAFSKIRMRGIKVADIAILMVAADDGVMPQTIEAIKFAKSNEVPIVVALNKIDKVDAPRIEVIKRQLAQHDLLPEEWGGTVVLVPISAKEGTGVDQLLEMIVLQSQLLELKADASGPAKGYVLESKIEKGRGPVATLICQHGKVKIGDYFVCGNVIGKVSSLVDTYGQRIKEAGPSIPVQVAGFDELPEAGDYFEVVAKEQLRKAVAVPERKAPASTILAREGSINLIIKTDTNSSKEALLEAIEKLSKKTPKPFAVIAATIGDVAESDIILASDTRSRLITLHTKADQKAVMLAQRLGVTINSYDIIYKLLEALEEVAQKAREVTYVRKKVGEATVLRVFDIKNIGIIAGVYVKEGRFSREGSVVVWRGSKKIGEGLIRSLQRDKKPVKEVHTNFECAFLVQEISDWAVDDRVECFIEVPEN